MSCIMCAVSGIERPVAARCRFCQTAVCSTHLAEAIRVSRGPQAGCHHVFVATGWLANALTRPRPLPARA